MRIVALAIALVLGWSATAGAEPSGADAPYCEDFVPEAAAVPVGGDPIDLHVLVLLDGIGLERGQEIFAAADRPYGLLGIRLVPEFRTVAFSGRLDTAIMGQAKQMLGGRRPDTAHAVYVLTAKDIVAQTASGEDEGVVGTAMCLGGIAMPDMAFAIGEDPDSALDDHGQKIAGHEIGHLLGGQHHYDNCAEGLADEGPFPLEPCGLMAGMPVGLLTLRFGSVSSAIVRGYAEKFVLPLPKPSPPAPAAPGAPAEPPAPAAAPRPAVRLTVAGRVRRAGSRLAVSLRSDGPVRGLTARLLRRGRTVAAGRLSTLDGGGTLRLRPRTRVRPGRLRLVVRGTSASGPVVLRRTVSVPR